MNRPTLSTLRSALVLVALIAVAGCSTTDSRISKKQSAFDSYPVEVQNKIRAGEVEVGFTAEMVEMAVGKPDERTSRTTADGDSEVWLYAKSKPSFGIGLGVGGGGGSTHVGTGVGIGTGGGSSIKLRVIMKDGKVQAVEKAGKTK